MVESAMNLFRHRLLLLLFLYVWWCSPPISSPTSAQRIPGFVSLDCGSSASNYTEPLTNLFWETDSSSSVFVGLAAASSTSPVSPPTSSDTLVSNAQLTSIRYFPGNQTKYCYTFDDVSYGIILNATYLVRATFWAGPSAASLPFTPKSSDGVLRFQLFLNSDVWTNVAISQGSLTQYEVHVVALSPSISVCLSGSAANSAFDTPFISSLEIRHIPIDTNQMVPLSSAMRPSASATRAVFTKYRINYGSSTGVSVRYPDDRYDRIWLGDTSSPQLSTTANVDVSGRSLYPPLPVMQTAFTGDTSLLLNGTNLADGQYLNVFLFAEISPDVNATGQRVFSYSLTTGASPTRVGYLDNLDILSAAGKNSSYYTYSPSPFKVVDNYLTFNFTKNVGSIFGPILSALILYRVSDNDASSGTDDMDAAAVKSIILSFPAALSSWSGDPCLPYTYDWLRCDSRDRPRIISISLPHKALSGVIPPSFANLTELQSLDLQGNNLSGSIPNFLGSLPKLTTLFLQDNNFTGDVPSSLVAKANSLELNLSVSGNPYLCSASLDNTTSSSSCSSTSPSSPSSSTKKDNNVPVVVGATIGGVFLLICLATIIFCFVRKCSKQKTIGGNGGQNATQMTTNTKGDAYVIRQMDVNQIYCFTYQEIQKVTNSFSRKLGRGGFGDVFYGVLSDGVHVAIKVSSKDSQEGAQAFLNEVALLSRVHHKNLVKLIGYCIENKLMLVYEYMHNGSLESILKENQHGKLKLTWSDRLRIALGSAEGLEYLHNGCTPAIIHRDVKSSNILLDENMEGKISDFGISRSTKTSSTDHTVTTVVGSRGYLPPNIMNLHKINEKVDVYAFGVVLLELVTGLKPIFTDGYAEHHIANWVKSNIVGGGLQNIVDPTIDHAYNVSSMWKVIDVAMICVSQETNARPQMSEVCLELKEALAMELHANDPDTTEFPTNFSMNPNNVDLYVR